MGNIVLDAVKAAVEKVGTTVLNTVAQTLSGAVNEINNKIPVQASSSNKCVVNSQIEDMFTVTERSVFISAVYAPMPISAKSAAGVDVSYENSVNAVRLDGVPKAWISFEFIISNPLVYGEVTSMTYSPSDGLTHLHFYLHNPTNSDVSVTFELRARIANLRGAINP